MSPSRKSGELKASSMSRSASWTASANVLSSAWSSCPLIVRIAGRGAEVGQFLGVGDGRVEQQLGRDDPVDEP